ncbi:hypothetical protein [Vibrio campbellii]|uniref:hypothetical protein n=1 Tax=Vibrio campbellii TaxID=680 RepID=UPI00210ADBA9|nr:hypothetical protein [Vibrio campbellii]UTZ44801.1 hypothetical protein HB764_26460 [Vibrio campbellii]UTZ44841.1 hypothetical protein HB764_26665 [Vibrio campbellii]
MKIAIVGANGVIENVIIGDESRLNAQCKFLSSRSQLWVGDVYQDDLAFTEDLPLESEPDKPEEVLPDLLEIRIASVDHALQTSSSFNKITANAKQEGQAMPLAMIHGVVAMPDAKVVVPVQQVNIVTGSTQVLYKQVDVKDGAFSFELNFPVGKYIINTDLLNAELERPTFTIPTTEIYLVI